MNDNNKQNHTKAVREGLESLQNCQKRYTLKKISKQISKQIDEDTDSKVPPEDVRSEIVEIINNDTEAAKEGKLLYSPSCEGEQQSKDEDEDEGLINRLIDYTVVLLGFGFLGVLLIFAPLLVTSESLASTLLLSSGAFYATIGVYLFSQANTCYSIGADRDNKELYDTGTEISRAGCLVSGGGAVSLTWGIVITLFNSPLHSWVNTAVLCVFVLVSQVLILLGLSKHEKQHTWFKDLREDQFPEENSGV